MRDRILSVIPFKNGKDGKIRKTEGIDLSVKEKILKLYYRTKTEAMYRK
jgi:hypothetical protein